MKDVKGYEGLYAITEYGEVYSYKSNKYLKPQKTGIGYEMVFLSKNGIVKAYTAHRLVAMAYINNPNNLAEVNHKDENKANNCVSNLEWCDHKYNSNHGTRGEKIGRKLSKKVLCVELGKVFSSTVEAYQKTGVNRRCISACCLGKIKTAGKMHWKYI